MTVQRSIWMLLGLGGVMLVPRFASAQAEPSQGGATPMMESGSGRATTTITKEGETTTTKVEPGQTTTTTWDAEGRTTTRTLKTQPGEKTTIVTKTTASAPVMPKLVPIYFQTDSDEIQPISLPLLDATAAAVKGNPGIQVVQIQGHADVRGAEDYNMALTDRRARAVSQALEERGVASDRLEPRGYGDTKPVCAAHDEDCWSQNRRVDIVPGSGDSAAPAGSQ